MREVDDIFASLGEFSDAVHAAHNRREHIERLLRNSAKTCGNCTYWMKSSECDREKSYRSEMDRRKALSMIVSCNDRACREYTPKPGATAALEELATLTERKP